MNAPDQRDPLDELGEASRDYYTDRYTGSTRASSERAEADRTRAHNRLTDAVIVAKAAEEASPDPNNTSARRVAIGNEAKRTISLRPGLRFDRVQRSPRV